MRSLVHLLLPARLAARILFTPLCAACLGALLCASAAAADQSKATVVFMRPGATAVHLELRLCDLTEDGAVPLGVLKPRARITRQFEPGPRRFLAYTKGGGMGSSISSYIEAELSAGQTYYIASHRQIGDIASHPAPRETGIFALIPFKNEPHDATFRLDSRHLGEWSVSTVESTETFEIDPAFAKRIQKAMPRLKKDYGAFRESRGDMLVLLANDSRPSAQPLVDIQLAAYADDAKPADPQIQGNRVAQLAPPSGLSEELIRDSILRAGRHRGYDLMAQSTDRLVFRLVRKGLDATYTVAFTRESVEIYSHTFRIDKPDAPAEEEGWTANLARTINVYLGEARERLRLYNEIVDFDPEGLADRDWGQPIATLAVPPGLSLGDIQEMIAQAGQRRQYVVVSRSPGHIALRLVHKGDVATYSFLYDTEKIQMRARVHKEKKSHILVERPRWADNLKSTIAVYLNRKAG